jgi:DNA polymerase-2
MNDPQPSTSGFLLTRQWRDRADGLELVFWISTDDGPVRAVIHGQEAVCFVPRNTDLDPWIRNFSIERRPLDFKR